MCVCVRQRKKKEKGEYAVRGVEYEKENIPLGIVGLSPFIIWSSNCDTKAERATSNSAYGCCRDAISHSTMPTCKVHYTQMYRHSSIHTAAQQQEEGRDEGRERRREEGKGQVPRLKTSDFSLYGKFFMISGAHQRGFATFSRPAQNTNITH